MYLHVHALLKELELGRHIFTGHKIDFEGDLQGKKRTLYHMAT
jgi:hypothetical protein